MVRRLKQGLRAADLAGQLDGSALRGRRERESDAGSSGTSICRNKARRIREAVRTHPRWFSLGGDVCPFESPRTKAEIIARFLLQVGDHPSQPAFPVLTCHSHRTSDAVLYCQL